MVARCLERFERGFRGRQGEAGYVRRRRRAPAQRQPHERRCLTPAVQLVRRPVRSTTRGQSRDAQSRALRARLACGEVQRARIRAIPLIGTVWCAQQESYSPSPMGVHCSRELEPRAPTHRCPIHPGIAMARLLAGNPSRCSTLNLPRSSAAMKVPSAAPSWMMCSRPNGLTSFHGGPVGTIGRGRWRRSKGVVDMSVTVIGPGMNSKPSSTHAERSGSASLRHHSRRYR